VVRLAVEAASLARWCAELEPSAELSRALVAADRGDFTAKTLVEYQRASRDHLRWIRARGLWIKGFDRILPRGMPFPFWVKYIVKVAAPWA